MIVGMYKVFGVHGLGVSRDGFGLINYSPGLGVLLRQFFFVFDVALYLL